MGMKRRPYTFAFFGAGEASYFEWAEVHVRFVRPPTPAEKKAIRERVPVPLRDSIDFDGSHLMVASGQFAHVAIAETYPGGADAVHPGDPSAWSGGRWFFAGTSQVSEFNTDTEAWLIEANRHCPIVAAYRHEDAESGGTELSPWHTWSLDHLDRVLPAFEEVIAAKGEHPQSHMLAGILYMARQAGKKMPAAMQAWLERGD